MINVKEETLVSFKDLPCWAEENLGKRLHPSTFTRWRIRGSRGVKLSTILIGGIRHTSEESLQSFFAASTAAADGTAPVQKRSKSQADAEAYLIENGVIEDAK